MNILLVNPWIYDFAAFDSWVKPLGLLYLSCFLKKAGHEVEYIDCLGSYEKSYRYGTHKFHATEIPKPSALVSIPRKYKRYGIELQEFEARLAGMCKPDLIGIGSMMTYWYPGVEEVVKICSRCFADVPIVIGGIYATLCTEHARNKFTHARIMPGFALDDFLRLIDELDQGHKAGGPKINTNDLFEVFPDHNLYDDHSSVAMLTSVGCVYRCTYCASHVLQPRFRQNSIERVLKEIDHYTDELQAEDIAFYDDALFFDSDRHIKPILRHIAQTGVKTRFHTPNGVHIKNIDYELGQLLHVANFRTLRLSFESSDPGRQHDSADKTSNTDLQRAVGVLDAVGFERADLGVYLLLGLPDQDLAEVRRSAEYVYSLGLQIYLAEYSPIPHTADFQKAVRINPAVAAEPLWQNNSVFPMVYDSHDLDRLFAFKTWVKDQNRKMAAK